MCSAPCYCLAIDSASEGQQKILKQPSAMGLLCCFRPKDQSRSPSAGVYLPSPRDGQTCNTAEAAACASLHPQASTVSGGLWLGLWCLHGSTDGRPSTSSVCQEVHQHKPLLQVTELLGGLLQAMCEASAGDDASLSVTVLLDRLGAAAVRCAKSCRYTQSQKTATEMPCG